MFMKYLSEYQPWRIRSTSSLKTEAGRRRRSKTLMGLIIGPALRGPGTQACGLLVGRSNMATSWARLADAALYRRGESITAWARAISVGFALVALFVLWGSPRTRAVPALLTGLTYIAFALGARNWLRGHPESRRWLSVVHDTVDAVGVGLGAAFSGGMESPIWLLLYAHVVAVSVRGGLGYALTMGVLDALVVAGLSQIRPSHPEGLLHTLSLLFCAFTGGTTSSYLHQIQRRLFEANRDLSGMNEQLR